MSRCDEITRYENTLREYWKVARRIVEEQGGRAHGTPAEVLIGISVQFEARVEKAEQAKKSLDSVCNNLRRDAQKAERAAVVLNELLQDRDTLINALQKSVTRQREYIGRLQRLLGIDPNTPSDAPSNVTHDAENRAVEDQLNEEADAFADEVIASHDIDPIVRMQMEDEAPLQFGYVDRDGVAQPKHYWAFVETMSPNELVTSGKQSFVEALRAKEAEAQAAASRNGWVKVDPQLEDRFGNLARRVTALESGGFRSIDVLSARVAALEDRFKPRPHPPCEDCGADWVEDANRCPKCGWPSK